MGHWTRHRSRARCVLKVWAALWWSPISRDKYPVSTEWASGVTVHHRRELIAVQESLREEKGVTALIYDQTCAAEKRRRRRRGTMEDPPRRLFINERVCEGCGDCSAKSNCVGVVPKVTPLGRKRGNRSVGL